MFRNLEEINSFHVYSYTFLDDLSAIISPEEHYKTIDLGGHNVSLVDYIEGVKKLLLSHGWEGDGTLGVIWIPPFVDVGIEDTWGTYVWHVKQKNNGFSWLASEVELNFSRLQGEVKISKPIKKGREVGIFGTQVEGIISELDERISDLKDEVNAIEQSNLSKEKVLSIKNKLLFDSQGQLVASFQDFLDNLYLELLIEVIDSGNQNGIKLKKIKTTLDLAQFSPELDGEPLDADQVHWFGRKSIISGIWKDFKFLAFKERLALVLEAINFKLPSGRNTLFLKHVLIRNCVQHHLGSLNPEVIKPLGQNFISIKTSGSDKRIEKWKPLEMSFEELNYYAEEFREFANDLNLHTLSVIKKRYYIHNEKSKSGN